VAAVFGLCDITSFVTHNPNTPTSRDSLSSERAWHDVFGLCNVTTQGADSRFPTFLPIDKIGAAPQVCGGRELLDCFSVSATIRFAKASTG